MPEAEGWSHRDQASAGPSEPRTPRASPAPSHRRAPGNRRSGRHPGDADRRHRDDPRPPEPRRRRADHAVQRPPRLAVGRRAHARPGRPGARPARPGRFPALAACTALTLEPYVRRKQWPVTAIRVRIEHDETRGDDGRVRYALRRRLTIEGGIDDGQRQRPLEMAEKCLIHRVLTGELTIESLTPAEAGRRLSAGRHLPAKGRAAGGDARRRRPEPAEVRAHLLGADVDRIGRRQQELAHRAAQVAKFWPSSATAFTCQPAACRRAR
ncbi:MAG: OsmC family protein [Comamonadaceae bacterium]|nr:OsmC family protein [Comamonadaceae bacterium]